VEGLLFSATTDHISISGVSWHLNFSLNPMSSKPDLDVSLVVARPCPSNRENNFLYSINKIIVSLLDKLECYYYRADYTYTTCSKNLYKIIMEHARILVFQCFPDNPVFHTQV
jgi:hypothetical protein